MGTERTGDFSTKIIPLVEVQRGSEVSDNK